MKAKETLKIINESRYGAIEEYMRLRIQPKPYWMPKQVWEYLIRHILIMDYYKE